MAVGATSQRVDYSDYHSAFDPTVPISSFPAAWQPIVERMRYIFTVNIQRDILGPLLGIGGFGRVFEFRILMVGSQRIYPVVKIFNDIEARQRETEMLWKCADIPAVAQMTGITTRVECGDTLILEQIQGSTLRTLLEKPHRPEESIIEIQSFARQFFQFLSALQKPSPPGRPKGVMHRDISGSNVLWENGALRVIDLGSACEIGKQKSCKPAKDHVAAPEFFLNQMIGESGDRPRFNESIDLWSAAILIDEFVTRRSFMPRWQNGSSKGSLEIAVLIQRIGMPPKTYLDKVIGADQFFNYSNGEFVLKPEFKRSADCQSLKERHLDCPRSSLKLLELLEGILRWDPVERLTPDQALNHPFFSNTPQTKESNDVNPPRSCSTPPY